ncbi:hypothetical protein [Bordetella petrii]|uniref:hypothetical protein n=1 Tax=Bordetella petrii TaxID=94624 RepID=UPI001A977D9D|nr:hypothetical protein [Bordetella petrii]MBO1112437.1 hypothetical protein [Bordetella petrii]
MESQYILNAAPACPPAGGLAARARAWREACAAWWLGIQTRRACHRTATQLSDLDDHILRDIGAPAWALRESEALRQIEHNRRNQWLRT